MESSGTSLCLLMLLETRGPVRKVCTPLWLAHPCHGNSPQAQTDCHRPQRAWISSRFQTRVLLESEDKQPADLPQQGADRSPNLSPSLRCHSARLCMPMMLRTQMNSASMPMTLLILLKKILPAGGQVDCEASRACFPTTMSPRSEAQRLMCGQRSSKHGLGRGLPGVSPSDPQ